MPELLIRKWRSGSALRRLGILSAIAALGAGVALAPGSGAPDAELVIDFDPLFIDGDFYTNTPARFVAAVWQTNGQYMVNPLGWYVSTVETGGLYVAIERSIFRTDALLALEFYDYYYWGLLLGSGLNIQQSG